MNYTKEIFIIWIALALLVIVQMMVFVWMNKVTDDQLSMWTTQFSIDNQLASSTGTILK